MKKIGISFLIILGLTSSLLVGQDFDTIIETYRPTADQLIQSGRRENEAYLKLQELCDDIGNRLSGSDSLNQAIQWAQRSMKADGQQNVRAEKVMVPKWVRGAESCRMVEPRETPIGMLGLGVPSVLAA